MAGRSSWSDSAVNLRRSRSNTTVRPFTLQELAALLSGGSSKEYESETTTGRFGTGFLVTHVLAQRTRLRGLLQVPTGCERFDLTLDRGGDEDTILDNIRDSNQAIRAATPVSDPADVPSAVLEYSWDEGDSWLHGLRELKRALPYLYATRRELGHVELRNEGDIETWEPSAAEQIAIGDGNLERRMISATGSKCPQRDFRVYRFAAPAMRPPRLSSWLSRRRTACGSASRSPMRHECFVSILSGPLGSFQ